MSSPKEHSALRIGLTGGIASGKSSVARGFKDLGIDVISADEIAKDILKKNSPALKQVVQRFGSDILDTKLELDRKKLREIIFNDAKQRKILNSITHPAIRREMVKLAQSSSSSYVVLEIPLLIESNLQNLVNRILVVTTELDTQLNRVMQRDNCTLDQAQNIINAQTSNEIRLQHADDSINNAGSFEKLNNQIRLLHKKYLHLLDVTKNTEIQTLSKKKIGLDLH